MVREPYLHDPNPLLPVFFRQGPNKYGILRRRDLWFLCETQGFTPWDSFNISPNEIPSEFKKLAQLVKAFAFSPNSRFDHTSIYLETPSRWFYCDPPVFLLHEEFSNSAIRWIKVGLTLVLEHTFAHWQIHKICQNSWAAAAKYGRGW